jgi:hypothetical protein
MLERQHHEDVVVFLMRDLLDKHRANLSIEDYVLSLKKAVQKSPLWCDVLKEALTK